MTQSGTAPVRRFGVVAILVATFLPAVLVIFGGTIAGLFQDVAGNFATMIYLLLESAILLAVMFWITRREMGSVSLSAAVPWQKPVSPIVFLALLVVVTAYAIFFRDFFRWPPMMAFAGTVRELVPFWPPEAAWRPNFGYGFDEFTGISRTLNIVIMGLCMAAVSAAQTLYFRGFLLPRMAWLGWWAPILNTALFAAFHLYSVPFWHFFFLFTLAWGFVTFATRNAWIAVISHMIFNTYSYGLLLVSS